MARPYSWTLLPLLLLPLIAVQRAAQMSREREHQALHDPLTGLPNRMLLADRIEHGLARDTRSGGRLVLVFLDLDMFKVVNDGLGHAAGDALLIEVAHRLASVVRAGDTLARFGGDEFAILVEDVPDDEVGDLTTRVTTCLGDPLHFQGRAVTVTASIGVAQATADATALSMLRDADAAMHRAKAAGRDRVVHFHTDMHHQDTARLDTEADLRLALDRGELRAHYQPIVDVQTETIIGVEALIRWQHPQRGLLLPGEFIPLAEETGLIVPLGEWMLDHALHQARLVRDQYPQAADLWVAVNLSARQLHTPGLVDHIALALDKNGIPAAQLHLEITETVVMNNLDTTLDTLNGLRSLGVHLAVDDFGTGYSSLSYLKQLPVSTLKIDRSFITDLGNPDSTDRPIVDAITNLAKALHLDVIAEGVETRRAAPGPARPARTCRAGLLLVPTQTRPGPDRMDPHHHKHPAGRATPAQRLRGVSGGCAMVGARSAGRVRHDALVNGEAVDRHPEPIVNLRDAYLIEVYLHRANSHRDTLSSPGDPARSEAAPAYLAHSPRRLHPPPTPPGTSTAHHRSSPILVLWATPHGGRSDRGRLRAEPVDPARCRSARWSQHRVVARVTLVAEVRAGLAGQVRWP